MNNESTTSTLMSPTFQVVEEKNSTTSARVVIEPLEQGYGHTLGNALRRVLLTSLPGTAISQVRIESADHQFSSIDGVTEDVLEITLNLKQVRVKSAGSDEGILRLSVNGPKNVTAADIQPEAGFEIINQDQYIATVAKGKSLVMEMKVATGVGYEVANDKKSQEIGEIMVDALYSPIIRVSYTVDATRVGRRTDYDRLMLDIQTDGTISPLESVRKAANILSKQFMQIVDPVVVEEESPTEELSPEEAEVMRLTVEELDLPTRIANALRKGGFKTVGDLVNVPRGVVAKVKNLGGKSVVVIDEALQKKAVNLGD